MKIFIIIMLVIFKYMILKITTRISIKMIIYLKNVLIIKTNASIALR